MVVNKKVTRNLLKYIHLVITNISILLTMLVTGTGFKPVPSINSNFFATLKGSYN